MGYNWGFHKCTNCLIDITVFCIFSSSSLLPPANEVCEGYVFTGVCLSTGGISVQRVSLSRGLCPEGSVSGMVSVWGSLSGWSWSRGSLSGGLCLVGLCIGDIWPGDLCPGGLCMGGLCPGGFCPGILCQEDLHAVICGGMHPT